MDVIIKEVSTKDYLTKSNLPASDYVVNPYTGCPHACKYCYACFMKRFTGHTEEWGAFIDVKRCYKPINIDKISGKSVFLSSVTDCYNKFEQKYEITRKILEQLVEADVQVTISTKSDLVLRDMDLFRRFKNLKVALSINTLDETFKNDMDNGSSIAKRMNALKILHNAGIYTVLFMSPIFPYITDYKKIIEQSKDFVCEYWFENLNLRGSYKTTILNYVKLHFPNLKEQYQEIYVRKNLDYWKQLSMELTEYCEKQKVTYINYFYHKELVQNKKLESKMSKIRE